MNTMPHQPNTLRRASFNHLRAGFSIINQTLPDLALTHFGEHWIEKSAWLSRDHKHSSDQLYHLISGTVTLVVEGDPTVLKPGCTVRIAPNLARHFQPIAESELQHLCYVNLFPDRLANASPSLLDDFSQLPSVVSVDDVALEHHFRLLQRELVTEGELEVEFIEHLLLSLMMDFTRCAKPNCGLDTLGSQPDRFVAHARHLLDSYPGHAWTIVELARQCHISPSHLAHKFSAQVGRSPLAYLRDSRLRRGAEWLRNTNLSITEIALEAGFSSSQRFATAFREDRGETPSEYRKRGIAQQ